MNLINLWFSAEAGLKVQYIAVYDNILHRLRFAKFLAVVAQELGDDVS